MISRVNSYTTTFYGSYCRRNNFFIHSLAHSLMPTLYRLSWYHDMVTLRTQPFVDDNNDIQERNSFSNAT